MGYLQDFLFSPDRALAPITKLSGGERNRLLLAKLFARPSNLLVMDEPTNDLDVETLELLEELLIDYPGTLILVSHDRAFLDNVVTSSLVMEGEGRVGDYVGGYSDWLRQRPDAGRGRRDAQADAAGGARSRRRRRSAAGRRSASSASRNSASSTQLPALIETLEARGRRARPRASNSPELYRQGSAEVQAAQRRCSPSCRRKLEHAYARWNELE